MTKIINPEKGNVVLDIPGVSGKMFYQSKQLELVNLKIDTGKSIESHKLPIDVVFYLVEGELEFTVDNKKINLNSTEVVEVKAFQERAVFNKSEKNATLLVMKQI